MWKFGLCGGSGQLLRRDFLSTNSLFNEKWKIKKEHTRTHVGGKLKWTRVGGFQLGFVYLIYLFFCYNFYLFSLSYWYKNTTIHAKYLSLMLFES